MMQNGSKHKRRYKKSLIVLNLLSLLLFLFFLYEVLNHDHFLDIDAWVSTHVPTLQEQTLTPLIVFITNMNGVLGSSILSLLLSLFLLYQKMNRDLLFYWMAFLGASALFSAIKLLVERTRPALKIINEQGFSFPSGHATMSMTIALSLYMIFVGRLHSGKARVFLLIVTLIWPVLIAFTRIYLNVHWLSDTLAGLTLGVFWVTLLVLLSQFRAQK